MERKEFLKLTDILLKEYGFIKIKKDYYLDLPQITIKFLVRNNRFCKEEICFSFVFSIKALKNSMDKIIFSVDDTHIINTPFLFSNPKHFKVIVPDKSMVSKSILEKGNSYFDPCNYSVSEWSEIFNEMLNRYFNPFKEDAFGAIRNANKERNNNLFFIMDKQTAEFIGVDNY